MATIAEAKVSLSKLQSAFSTWSTVERKRLTDEVLFLQSLDTTASLLEDRVRTQSVDITSQDIDNILSGA